MNLTEVILWFLRNILFINILLAILIVFFERRNPTSVWAWLMILFFIPIVGFILYLFLGQDLRRKKMFKEKEEEDQMQNMIHIQEQSLYDNEFQFYDPELESFRDMVHFHLKSNNALYSSNNSVKILVDGDEKFHHLIESIRNAKQYIHMEYYIIRNDALGKEIVSLLAEKAAEGVEVKLLYDGMGCIWLPRKFFNPIIKAGGQVCAFFPPFIPYLNLRMNFRNHRKICIIDGQEGFVGGLNIGVEYLGLSKKFGYWRDTHLLIRGHAVDSLQARFLLDWNFSSIQNKITDRKPYFPEKSQVGNTGIQIVSSGPDSKWHGIKNGFIKMIMEAEKNIYIQTPYFVPDDSILEALKVAALSGVDVRIMIPNKPDHPFVYWASLSYIAELLQAGARCYTYEKGFIHCKTMTVDGLVNTVGTANMDIRSFKLNFEVNAFVYDPAVTKKLEKIFIQDIQDSEEITIEKYKKRPYWIRFKESISRLLSPIL
ncbi:MAG: cardiolipin synthase [Epulopiscium sp.]|nr:cardiolipin synthase [Candidatus Epulonipiscium sp.]